MAKAKLKPTLRAIGHRSPDGSGIDVAEYGPLSVVLGHARLAVLDLSPLGHQPKWSRDRRYVVAFNGEIYNHLELRRRLNLFCDGASDTATLVELITSIGVEASLPLLNGMFAVAVVDTRERTLWVARDPLGK